MKNRIGLAGLVLAAIALSGCAGAGEPTSSVTSSASPSPTEDAALPKVSLETSCMFLFGTDLDGPVPDSADIINRFVAAPDLSTVTADEIEEAIAGLENASENADEAITPYIDASVAPLHKLLDALNGAGNGTVEFDDYKAASIELLNQCKPFL